MTQRRADARGYREHGGDAGHDRDVERAKTLRTVFDLLADCSSHGEHARIAARHNGDARTSHCIIERRGRARSLFTIIGCVTHLARTRRNALKISSVAVEHVGIF